MIIDKTGSLANVKRHDYLPFGEELLAGQGGRTTALGYSGEAIRQKFTSKERDNETGLDYFGARYYASTQGRFTSTDPAWIKLKTLLNPQDLNRYSYVANNPLKFADPTGREKVEVIIRTYIPRQSVTYPPRVGATFNGNVDSHGRRLPGKEGFKTEQRITIETDANKSVLVYDQQASTGPTHRVARGIGNFLFTSEGQSDGSTLKQTASRDSQNTVTAHISGNESNPIVTDSPGISFHFNVSVTSDGPNSTASVSINGTHDGFPAYELQINRPEAGTTTITNLHDPNKTGDTPRALYPPEEKKVNKTIKIDP
jgi:RHS repeat-associated protein